jgi:nucleotide-binding universal stress UspA family protein
MRDGRVLKLWVTQLPGFERIFRALRQAGVPLEPELAKAIDEDLATAEPEPGPGRAGKPAAAVLVVLACLGTLVWQFWPETVPSMKREPTYTYEALAERQALLEAMRKVAEEMGGAAGTPRFDELMKQHDELEARYNAILPTEEE